jgi:DNA-binding PadR family transcriptional regulator
MRSHNNNEEPLDQSGPGRGHRRPSHGGPGWPGRPGRPARGEFVFPGDGPPPPPWAARRMRRGDIRTAVLSALQDGPGHGYELMSRLSERTGGRWRPSPGSVYPMLQALQDEGLVTSAETDGKRVFSLTDAGQAEATERVSVGGNPWEFGNDDAHHKLRNAVMQFIGAAKQVGMSGAPEVLEKAEVIVTDARRKLYQLLAES